MSLRFVLSIILALFSVSPALAETYQLDGVDITPVVEYYNKKINVLSHPMVTFNWSQTDGSGAFDNLDADDSLESVRPAARSFWQNFGAGALDRNVYGFGLYTAADPAITISFGRKVSYSPWLLRQFRFPPGMKILELGPAFPNASAEEKSVLEVMLKFQCDTIATDALFNSAGKKNSEPCNNLVRTIFKEILQIDAFSYPYFTFSFDACPNDVMRNSKAFVTVKDDWMKSGDVLYFTAKTKSNVYERAIIQTLFLSIKGVPESVKSNPLISQSDARLAYDKNDAMDLLWSDLEGMKKPDVSSWIRNFKYRCEL